MKNLREDNTELSKIAAAWREHKLRENELIEELEKYKQKSKDLDQKLATVRKILITNWNSFIRCKFRKIQKLMKMYIK